MFIRRSLIVVSIFISLYLGAQNKKPVSYMGSAPLSSTCNVSELPPDKKDTTVRSHQEPQEPDRKDPRFIFNKRKLPATSWSNYFEDRGRVILNKTNSGDIQLGTTSKFSIYTQGTPPDNTMAISNDGKIVASINVKIGFYDSTGTRLIANDRDIASFINDPLIAQSSLFDPRLIYDPKADRFIYVVLSGSSETTSKVIIGFSQTNNPQGVWKFYKLNGNFDGSSSWFDYPNIAITDKELIITGNLFLDPSQQFNQVVVLQINKAEGYSGAANLNFKFWINIQDGTNNNAFTLVPAVNGSNDSTGSKVFLVSSTPPSNSVITIYEITKLWNDPASQMLVTPVTVETYSTPTNDAQQKGTSRRLDIKKNRIRSAYYSGGIVHYAYSTPTNTFGAVSAVAYGRYDVSTKFNKVIYIGETGFNLAFPSIMHFSNLETKNTTLLTYLISNNTIFPEIRALSIDDNMVPSASILVKTGDGFVNYGIGNNERWGDYTCVSRKYNSLKPEAWIFGCYGETTHAWGNFIAQVKANPDIPPPVTSANDSFYFSPNPTLRYLDLNVSTADTATFRLRIYSLKGQLVREETVVIPKGKHGKTYDLIGLSPEEYILKLSKNEIEIKTTKLILLGK